jgi:hypothetical protein
MKNIIKTFFLASFVSISFLVSADPPTPPPDPGGGNPGPVGAPAAPIGAGLGILLVMGGAYGSRKLYQAKTEKMGKKASANITAVRS